jgi:hypothetical protein
MKCLINSIEKGQCKILVKNPHSCDNLLDSSGILGDFDFLFCYRQNDKVIIIWSNKFDIFTG